MDNQVLLDRKALVEKLGQLDHQGSQETEENQV